MSNSESTATKKKKSIVIILLVLLAGSLGFNIFQIKSYTSKVEQHENQYSQLSEEHTEVNQLLEDSKALAKKLEGDVAEKDEEIQSKLAEIKRIKLENDSLIKSGMNKEELNRRLKANLAMVRKLNKQLESKVDELLLKNKKLETKNTALVQNLDSVKTINTNLSEKVAIASTLQVPSPTINTYKKRNSKNKPWKKTSLARRTNKVEVKFTIMANEITEPGEKAVSLKIVSANGSTVGTLNKDGEDSEVQANGSKNYAAHKTFTYTGAAQNITLDYITDEAELAEGIYTAEILIDGEVANRSGFELK